MMEKIKVLSIKPVDGKKFWSGKLEDDRRVTVWPGNDGNNNLIKAIQQNLNVECDAVLKPFGNDGFNLRAFTPSEDKPEPILDTGKQECYTNPPATEKLKERKSVKGSAYEKDPVGLAVEVFNVMFKADMDNNTFMPDARMEDAITAVKQAQEAFN